jgi:ParB family transcriptional regulator, chromosome partitioning protein
MSDPDPVTEAPKKRPSGLGRGLSALLGEIATEAPVRVDGGGGSAAPATGDGVRMIAVGNMQPLPNQPRRNFDEAAIDELAASIKSLGLLQPILVREMDGYFQIIAGERRWRAAQKAQFHQVPVIIKEFDDRTALEIALVENIQREQLNAWEEGETYRRLIDDYGHSQEALARIVGKSRSHVANLMRLHKLPAAVHHWLATGALTMGHARALLLCEDPEGLAVQVMERHLSVRQTEALAKNFKRGAPAKAKKEASRDADLVALERQLGDLLGLKVQITHAGKGGAVTLKYSTLDQLDMICLRLSGEKI